MRFLTILGLGLAAPVWGQTADPLMQSILPRYQTIRLNLVESAELMPEDAYSFKLTPAQRSFAEWMEHNVQMNYGMCAAISGETAPPGKAPASKAKADIVRALVESFDYCGERFERMTGEKALHPVQAGGRTVYPVNVMVGLVANWNEHYGNIVGYLRTKGLVPPSTARAAKKK